MAANLLGLVNACTISLTMGTRPPTDLVNLIHDKLEIILQENPAATSSESYVQHLLEFELLTHPVDPPYYIRIGINYHGAKVQHIQLNTAGKLVGWNNDGDALGTGAKAKMLLAGHTIFDRDPDEPMMNDSKIGGGPIPTGQYVRVEYKVRGWLGKTKNLDGKQLEKDLNLLRDDNADLLVIALSETAYRKWRGEGPAHQAARRTGTARFRQIFDRYNEVKSRGRQSKNVKFDGQDWVTTSELVEGALDSIMPHASHIVTTCYRGTVNAAQDSAPQPNESETAELDLD